VAASIYWYDFETFGVDPRRDRASQFAGIRTDENLNIIDEPQSFYCQPADDFLPSPVSCLITGITPQKALTEGVPEAEFIARIADEFQQPATCVAGYNSIRFDDEVTRQLLYRNFYDPYEREWQNGNSRWDIIDMLRLCAAVRPQGINWPMSETGHVSFRLEELTKANNIEHENAHDALSDVYATIAMAKIVKEQQPKLYEYVYQLRNKKRVLAEIDLATHKPFVHVSGMYAAEHGRLALVMPLCRHPSNNNGIVVYDLRADPDTWLHLSTDEIRRRVFTPQRELGEGEERIPLKTIHVNRCPIVAAASVLEDSVATAIDIDRDSCRAHWQRLQSTTGLQGLILDVLRDEPRELENDPDFMIYSGGFFSDADKSLMRTVRGTPPADLGRLDLPFRDRRLPEMLFRYRARNYPDTLSDEEQGRWQAFRDSRLADAGARARYEHGLDEARERGDTEQQQLIDEVEQYVAQLSPAAGVSE